MAAADIKRLKEPEDENTRLEYFNGSFRREFLNTYLFESLSQVKEIVRFWLQDDNRNRTHESE